MKHLTAYENFEYLASSEITNQDMFIIGNYVIFNYFKNDGYNDDKPYRYVAKILDKINFNRLKVKVIKRIFNDQVKNNKFDEIKVHDIIDVHIGNIVLQTSKL